MITDMPLFLYNSLTKRKEEFIPISDKEVLMYVCGPTVYDTPHIGNIRTFLIYDVLYRILNLLYPSVKYVRNITDIEDKIILKAKSLNIPITQLTSNIIKEFVDISTIMKLYRPTIEPKATENIPEMIEIIQKLLEHKNAYIAEGDIFFSVDSFREYGTLAEKNITELVSGTRVQENPKKKNTEDFILWKKFEQNRDMSQESIFDSPWGPGRPGWHLECSAMANKYLGENIDIHGGGVDLKFPHHENEIAQSKSAFKNSNYAKYWVHSGFLLLEGKKMSKSLNNVLHLKDLLKDNYLAVEIRYYLLSTNYKKPLNFSIANLDSMAKTLRNIHNIIYIYLQKNKLYESFIDSFFDKPKREDLSVEAIEVLCDDMNISKFIVLINKYLKAYKDTNEIKYMKLSINLLKFMDFLELDYIKKLNDEDYVDIDAGMKMKLKELQKYRLAGNYTEADKIRNYFAEKGFRILNNNHNDIMIEKIKK